MLVRCKRCLYWSNHPLGITFDSEGICSGCKVHEEKFTLDWKAREEKFRALVAPYRNVSKYDCIVPVTGGQDSFYIVHLVTKVLGLRPLLVNFNRNFNSKEGIKNLSLLRNQFDVDFRQFTMNPRVVREIVATTLSNMGTINWVWIAGQTSYPVRLSIEMDIPLIIWGAHQGLEQVGMYSHLDEVEMTSRYRKEHDLMGVSEKEIFQFSPNIMEQDLLPIKYPNDAELIENKTKGVYIGNFFRWDTVKQNNEMALEYGYIGRAEKRSFYQFDNPDCPVYFGLQDILKFAKFGYSKATDQLTREIRFGRMSRKKALTIEKKLQSRTGIDFSRFAEWLGCSEEILDMNILLHSRNFASMILDQKWRAHDRKSEFNYRPRFKSEYLDKDFENIGKGIL